jgi:drug/metabolite transporter (DMT)-like permease
MALVLRLAVYGTVQSDILAMAAAIGWAINSILVRKGAKHSAVASAVLLSLLSTVSFLWAASPWFFPSGFMRSPAVVYFVLGGLIQPAFVRFLKYTGISRLGASRSQALRAVTPLFASGIALIALHERPGLEVYVAIVLTVTGIALVSYRRAGESHWNTIDLCFPLSAAILAGLSQNLRKAGLILLHNALVAAALTTSTSLVVFILAACVSGNLRALRPSRKSLPFYWAAALISTISQILSFAALSEGDVSVVVTLTSTSPLFTVALSRFFLKDQETVDGRAAVGALSLVAAIAMILNR